MLIKKGMRHQYSNESELKENREAPILAEKPEKENANVNYLTAKHKMHPPMEKVGSKLK